MAWGGARFSTDDPFQKEIYALYHLLHQFCSSNPEILPRAQVLMDVDSQAVHGAFNRGSSRTASSMTCSFSSSTCRFSTSLCFR